MKGRMEIVVGRQVGEDFEIPSSGDGPAVAGRGAGCEIRIADRQLSRRHCKFWIQGGHVFVDDLDSKNGTFVNGHAIKHRTQIKNGDKVRIGSTQLELKCEESVDEARTPRPKTPADQFAAKIARLDVEEFAQYRLERRIAEGEIFCTFLARSADGAEPIALKFVKPDASVSQEQKERFVRGARAAAKLDHPHVVKVLKVGHHEQIPYVVMEYIESENLRHRLAKAQHPMKVGAAVLVCRQLLDVLQHIHDCGMVLRDVRPDNLLTVKDFGVKVTGFSLLKLLPGRDEKELTQMTDEDVLVEASFAAPELIARPFAADQRSDVFGAAACLYYLLTVRAPFTEEIPDGKPALAFQRSTPDPAQINPQITHPLRDVIQRGLSNYLDKRYQSAREMGKALQKITKDT